MERRDFIEQVSDMFEVLGLVRACFITFFTVAIGIAYIVVGNTAGHIVGGVILVTVGVYVRNSIRRSFPKAPRSRRPGD